MKKILITGGSGFIGSHLVENFCEKITSKNFELFILDNLSSGVLSNIKKYIGRSRIFFIQNDVIRFCFKSDLLFDEIYHLASKIDARTKNIDDFSENFISVQSLISKLKKNGKFVFASSAAVYGDCLKSEKISEGQAQIQNNIYGCSKFLSEELIKKKCSNYLILRFANVFGERQNSSMESGLIAKIEHAIQNNGKILLYNRGEGIRDYIYVKDVVEALVLKTKNLTLNVSSGKGISTHNLVLKFKVKFDYKKDEVDENKCSILNNERIQRLGWSPTLSAINYLENIYSNINRQTNSPQHCFGRDINKKSLF